MCNQSTKDIKIVKKFLLFTHKEIKNLLLIFLPGQKLKYLIYKTSNRLLIKFEYLRRKIFFLIISSHIVPWKGAYLPFEVRFYQFWLKIDSPWANAMYAVLMVEIFLSNKETRH